jgi:hypothetical protein
VTRGIITIALGSPTYIRMAKDFALSARKHCPTITRAVVTDSADVELASLFDVVIPVDPSLGDPLFQKLWLDKYNPFDQTLFIDCDSLLVGDIDFVWRACDGHSCGFVGEKQTTGSWYGADIAAVCRARNLPWLATLNSGMIFLRADQTASKVFASAREAMGRYESLGFQPFRETRTDEVGFALAFSEHGVEPLDDPEGHMMRTPIGIEGQMRIDVLRGYCQFIKRGQHVAPTIVHFATWQFHPVYYRERARLRLDSRPWSRPLATLGAACVYWRERALEMQNTVKHRARAPGK